MFFRISAILFISLFSAISAFAGDPYTVKNVHVDARADNALEAQTLAISEGYMQAANILVNRLSLKTERTAKGFTGVNEIDSKKMIRAQGISNEKRSSTHYIADVTVSFNPSAVSQYMRAHSLTLVASQSRPRLVIPMDAQGIVSESDPWYLEWADGKFDNALTPIQVMTRRPEHDRILYNRHADNLKLSTLKTIGQVYGVEQILIATMRSGYAGPVVTLKDVALDSGLQRSFGPVSSPNFLPLAAASVALLEEDWKASTVTPISTQSVTMPVSVLYRSHAEWQKLQDVINGTAQIRGAKLEAISKTGAMMMITYGGDFDRLRNELSFKGVSIKADVRLGTVLARTGYVFSEPKTTHKSNQLTKTAEDG